MNITKEQLALKFHETYERLAPEFGYETRSDTKKFDPESNNGRLMIAVCEAIMRGLEDAAPVAQIGMRDGVYVDSTPLLHVGSSAFEDWYQAHEKACTGDKQLARDAYAAGMGDPLVTYATSPQAAQTALQSESLAQAAQALAQPPSEGKPIEALAPVEIKPGVLYELKPGGVHVFKAQTEAALSEVVRLSEDAGLYGEFTAGKPR